MKSWYLFKNLFIYNWSVYPLFSSTKNGTSARVRLQFSPDEMNQLLSFIIYEWKEHPTLKRLDSAKVVIALRECRGIAINSVSVTSTCWCWKGLRMTMSDKQELRLQWCWHSLLLLVGVCRNASMLVKSASILGTFIWALSPVMYQDFPSIWQDFPLWSPFFNFWWSRCRNFGVSFTH